MKYLVPVIRLNPEILAPKMIRESNVLLNFETMVSLILRKPFQIKNL